MPILLLTFFCISSYEFECTDPLVYCNIAGEKKMAHKIFMSNPLLLNDVLFVNVSRDYMISPTYLSLFSF